jgi:hypothetical protein
MSTVMTTSVLARRRHGAAAHDHATLRVDSVAWTTTSDSFSDYRMDLGVDSATEFGQLCSG